MTVLRELVARFGFQVDGKSFSTAEARVGQVKNVVSGLVGLIGGAGVAQGVASMVRLASDANESMNVISEVFRENTRDVLTWADTTATEVGRSAYTLRDFASQVGALVGPMSSTRSEAAKMSTDMAKLAVDLSSFFNSSETDALIALKAGLIGEAEPMRRFGVAMSEAALQEFALAEGTRKRVKEMDNGEKSSLRYRFIMRATTQAQGDAARTANGYANASRALKDGVKDLATNIGAKLLPGVEAFVLKAREWVNGAREIVNKTTIVESTIKVLGAAAAVAALRWGLLNIAAGGWSGALAAMRFTGVLVGLAGIALLVDDVNALFSGGKSVIGEYMDKIGGIGTADQFVKDHAAGVQIIAEAWDNVGYSISAVLNMGEDIMRQLGQWGDAIGSLFSVERALNGATVLAGGKGKRENQMSLSGNKRATGRGVNAGIVDTVEEEQALSEERTSLFERKRKAAQAADKAARAYERATRQGLNTDNMSSQEAYDATHAATQRALGRGANATVETVAAGRANVAAPPVTINQTTTINAQGNPDVVPHIRRALDADRRKALAALAGQGGG